jgi:hypothetical protein
MRLRSLIPKTTPSLSGATMCGCVLGARDIYEALPSTGCKIATLRRSPCGPCSHWAGDVRRLLK